MVTPAEGGPAVGGPVTGAGPAPRITTEPDRCCGGGMCVLTAPSVFTQSDVDGVVELLVVHPSPDQLRGVRMAVQTCPTSAIRLEE